MQKSIEIAKKISHQVDSNWHDELENANLLWIFKNLYKLFSQTDANTIVAFIIYAYDPDSGWIDINKNRAENKEYMLTTLGVNINKDEWQAIINGDNNTINRIVVDYLDNLTDYRWQQIMTEYDYHSKMIRFVSNKTASERTWTEMDKDGNPQNLSEDIDIDKQVKVNKEKGLLLQEALAARKRGDELLAEIKRDYLKTDEATKQDFKFTFTDVERKTNIMSYREWLKREVLDKKPASRS